MNVTETALSGVLLVQPSVHRDSRGALFESFHAARYAEHGIAGPFVQDNVSRSRRRVLRGLHFQHPRGQGKLVGVVHGAIFDVAVDIRRGSPSLGHWVGHELSADNRRQLYIPPGFAHGFVVLSEIADVYYKCTEYYDPAAERGILWNDPALGIAWPVIDPVLSDRDMVAPRLREIDGDALPPYATAAAVM